MKKLLTGITALGLAIALIPMVSAYEAHVINVTATIDNALTANVYSLDFGTVFPQEKFDKQFTIGMSNSFQADQTYDDIEYVLRQKPKCQLNEIGSQVIPALPQFGQVTEEENIFVCKDEVNYDLMAFLCPYLSKAEVTTDGTAPNGENDMNVPESESGHLGPVYSFHGPILVASSDGEPTWDLQDTLTWQQWGRLAKSDQDTSDQWNIDLKVPCFGNHCAQDWADFFLANGGSQNGHTGDDAADYIQPIGNEHLLFGCDLWVEVKDLSFTPETATLTVNKILITDNGGNETATNFQLFVDATAVSNGVANVLAPGSYVVTEIGVSGYQATFSGDCNAGGQITLVAGQNKQCTITNDDIAPNVTLIKSVTNNGTPPGTAPPFQFTLRVDGNVVPQNTSVAVTANSSHSITEDPKAGYSFTSITGANCPTNLGDLFSLNEGQAITCTITNDDN
ncbi:MAG: hypothetical protein AAB706_01135 [Patescibacteria group bacterium]